VPEGTVAGEGARRLKYDKQRLQTIHERIIEVFSCKGVADDIKSTIVAE
jgi:hypothetical protein